MNSPKFQSAGTSPGPSPAAIGTACCIASALGYSMSNICLRQLAELQCDPMWVTCNKELVTVVVVGPWVLYRLLRGQPALPPLRLLAMLAAVGLAVQMGANLAVQWALGVIGLAVTIPIIFGVMLTVSGVLGRFLLGERISRRSLAAIGMLLASLALLGLAAVAAGKSVAAVDPWRAALGIAAAGMAGAIYAVLTITIRHTVTNTAPISAVVVTITLMAVLTLGPASIFRLGTQVLWTTPPQQILWIVAAGTLNLIAFLAISKGLEITTAVHANMLNATQVAMAGISGMLLFDEPLTPWLAVGVTLTVAGIILFERPVDGLQDPDLHA